MQTRTRLKLVSVGPDVSVESGSVSFHSKFSNAVNLILDGNNLVSIVTNKVGGGPNNIVLNAQDVSFINVVKWNESYFMINGEVLLRNTAKVYNPLLSLHDVRISDFLTGLNFFERLLIKNAPPLSAAFLLDDRRKNFFITPFEKNLRISIRNSVDRFLEGDLSAISKLKGLGFGLTPQGDDLIDGFVSALLVYEFITKVNTYLLRNKIYSAAETSNLISNTFLRYAVKGMFYQRVKELIEAVALNDKGKIINSTEKLLNIGETSGSDIGAGFVLMSRKSFEGGIKWL